MKKKARQRTSSKIPEKVVKWDPVAGEGTTSGSTRSDAATMSSSREVATYRGGWPDATTADVADADDSSREPHVETYAQLADKLIFRNSTIPFILLVATVGWVFIQDNGAGKLDNRAGLKQFVIKAFVLFGVFLVVNVVAWATSWIRRWHKRRKAAKG